MADYEVFREYAPGQRQPKEPEHRDGNGHDQAAVAKAIEHRRPDTLAPSGAARLQRLAGNAATSSLVAQREAAEDPVHSVLNSGGGSGLDTTTRQSMETKLGHDFSGVKVHQGPQAADAAKSVQAQAFTVGNNIVLGEGKSASDERTMAHELTHVVQQRNGDVPGQSIGNGLKLSDPSDWAERQAEATADEVVNKSDSHAGHDHASAGAGNKASVQTLPEEETADVQKLDIQRQEEEAPEEEKDEAAQDMAPEGEEEAEEEKEEG